MEPSLLNVNSRVIALLSRGRKLPEEHRVTHLSPPFARAVGKKSLPKARNRL